MGIAQNIIGLTEYYCRLNESLGNTFKPSYKLNVLSKLKSQISLLNKSNVVYKLACEEFYIGQTTRRLKKRIQEHKTKEFSSVYRHSSITDHKFNCTILNIMLAKDKYY